MLNYDDQENLAQSLTHLRGLLFGRPETLLSNLPQELQDQVRSQTVLGAMTTSGLEKISTIIDRIDWALYYLERPELLKELDQPETQPEPLKPAAPEKIEPVKEVLPERPEITAPPAPPKGELDFGPFDPRKGHSNAGS